MNYGLRFDRFNAYTADKQVSPRLNVVWQALADTTVHAGYSRYLSPPPFELVGGKDISLFENTSSPPLTKLDSLPQAEHANYFDAGVQQKVPRTFTMGLDTYYKQSSNLIDEGQFGAPIILTPFNYRYGKQYGAELTANYTTGRLNAYLNLAVQSAKGKDIDSAQFNFSPSDLDYIAHNWIHLDHEQQHTASGGISYLRNATRVSADFLLGSGLRADEELPPGETHPCIRHSERGYPHRALRCDQRIRQDLSDPQRHRCGRGRAAVRTPSRLFLRSVEIALRPRSGAGVRCPCTPHRRGHARRRSR